MRRSTGGDDRRPIGGLDGYLTRTYQYDAIGNMTLGDGGYYHYESVRPHAVITVGNPPSSMSAYYGYDGNGSATFVTRTLLSKTYALTYDPENRVKQMVPSDGPTAIFRYDGDGTRVLGIVGGVTTTYAGTWYEYTTEAISYYYFNGQRVAMRSATGVTYTHRDHLGSGVATTGAASSEQRYDAWGETRGASTVDTPYRYTGQREEDDLLLYFYRARWYDAALGRFIQADSIVPDPRNPQTLNRYSYVLNNPTRFADPSGHSICVDEWCVELVRVPADVRERHVRAVWLLWVYLNRVGTSRTLELIRAANTPQSPLSSRQLEGPYAQDVLFAMHVAPGADWDMKAVMRAVFEGYYQARYQPLEPGGPEYYYDVFGNVAYGYWGAAAGYQPAELLAGAGAAQYLDDTWGHISSPDEHPAAVRQEGVSGWQGWDNPGDQRQIGTGIALWEQYGLDISRDQLVEALKVVAVLVESP